MLEGAFRGSPVSPGGVFIEGLRQSVEDWLADLRADPSVLQSDALRLTLIESLDQVLWLIANRNMFGDAPVARAAQQTLGAVALAAPQVRPEGRAKWKKGAVALALYTGIVVNTQTAIESTESAVVAVIEAGEVIVGELMDDD